MAGSQKKVIVRRYDAPLLWGYLASSNVVTDGRVQVLDPAAKIISIDLNTIKTISYVRDFNLDDQDDPERIGRRTYQGRPRGEGLWIRLEFLDRDVLEGLTPFDLAFLDEISQDRGLFLFPPDPKSNTQRVFIPRASLTRIQVLGWITSPSRQKSPKQSDAASQGALFEM